MLATSSADIAPRTPRGGLAASGLFFGRLFAADLTRTGPPSRASIALYRSKPLLTRGFDPYRSILGGSAVLAYWQRVLPVDHGLAYRPMACAIAVRGSAVSVAAGR